MSEVPTPDPTPGEEQPLEPQLLPRWVPVAIGVVLVTLAALAVATGLRYRDDTLVGMVESRRAPQTAGGPPGAPEPGASRMMSGDSGSSVPGANAALEDPTGTAISGGPEGVSSVVRMFARRGMIVEATPPDAVVYVNGVPVGHARELNSEDETYDFAAAGSYDVRIVAPGYAGRQFIVTVGDEAQQEVARIDVKLEKQ